MNSAYIVDDATIDCLELFHEIAPPARVNMYPDVDFTSVCSNPSVFDTSSIAKSSNSKRELQNEQRLVKGEVTMCVGSGSKIDMIIIAHSLYFRD